MIDGIVSNCWQTQLAAGESLDDVIAESFRRGCRTVELRQGSLGEYETAAREPLAERLASLPSNHPGIRFNVAIEIAFLAAEPRIDAAAFSAGKWAADAVAGETPPHLRLVDLSTKNADWNSIDAAVQQAAARIVELTRSMIAIDGALSLEHSLQRWDLFRSIFDAARQQLGRDADRLRLCFDPCNLLIGGDDVDAAEVTASLSTDAISMVHFKQRRDNKMPSTVDDGEIDWPAVHVSLQQIGYAGPGLLEIPPAENIWENLEASREFLRCAGFE